jgi:hypothetical protein
MVDTLTAMLSIVYHNAVAVFMHVLLLGHLRYNDHQVAEESCVAIFCFAKTCEAIAIFWDN